MAASAFETLPRILATSYLLPYLASSDWLRVRVASRSCHDLLHAGGEAEALWRVALVREYRFVEGTTDDDGRDVLRRSLRCRAATEDDDERAFLSTADVFTASTAFVSWKHWRKIDLRLHCHRSSIETLRSWEKLVGPYFLRAAALWQHVEQWCDDVGRSGTVGGAIKSSLLPGRPLDPSAEHAWGDGRRCLSAFQAVYAFYAGQRAPPSGIHRHAGLFGGIQVYDFVASTRMSAPDFRGDRRPSRVLLAQGEGKAFGMEVSTGRVHCFARHQQCVATPRASGSGHCDDDAVLRWFEEHARRLRRDFYAAGRLKGDGDRAYAALLRYPAVADAEHCSRAVSRGVEVVASAVLCPEIQMFVYSVRMRVLGPEDGAGYRTPAQRGFATCQLVSRHWRIRKAVPDSDAPAVDEVRGDGVIGYYPLLYEGGYESHYGEGPDSIQIEGRERGYFSYQSCTQPVPGSFEGYLQFVPGTLSEPSGDVFDVRVNPFPLKLPDFLH